MVQGKLAQDVKRFLDVYKVLSPEAKVAFEAQLAPTINGADERTKKLYSALVQAARDGLDTEGAIKAMEEASQGAP